ncbi:MAG: phytanoyl-CoA dioxygenase family protein [Phycisphaeraceae bacterium]|nr:phytanoyl-CoA dioxygenase family protein [Phycisphaeraceae bacterium]
MNLATTIVNDMNLKQQYDRDGYVVVRGLYEPAAMLAWKEALRQALKEMNFNHPSGVHVWFDRKLPQPVLDAMRDDRVMPILRQIIGDHIEYLSAKAVFKDAKTKFGSPWHQDWYYWEGSSKLSVWIALDDAIVGNGCLTFIPGTHTRVFPRKSMGGDSFAYQIDDKELAGLTVVDGVLQRGDAVFFHDLTVHGSHPNTVGGDRWSLISTYRDASVPDASTTWKSSWLISGSSVNPGAQP